MSAKFNLAVEQLDPSGKLVKFDLCRTENGRDLLELTTDEVDSYAATWLLTAQPETKLRVIPVGEDE